MAVFVLPQHFRYVGKSPDYRGTYVASEAPLLLGDVALVDPSDRYSNLSLNASIHRFRPISVNGPLFTTAVMKNQNLSRTHPQLSFFNAFMLQETHSSRVEVHRGGRAGPCVGPDRPDHPEARGGAAGRHRAAAVER